MKKYFPQSKNNSEADWYPGKVVNHFYENEMLYNFVQYDDGDSESLGNAELAGNGVRLAEGNSNKKARGENRIKQEDSDNEEKVELSESNDEELLAPPSSLHSKINIQPATANMERTVKMKKETEAKSDPLSDTAANQFAIPERQLSASETIVAEVYSTMTSDDRVKIEGSASSLSPQERKKREGYFKSWQAANTDPQSGKGRYVFRRGCHAKCITKVLGGSGMDPWPIVDKTPVAPGYLGGNPFISSGEFYVADSEDWNPFGPRFPGDSGCVNCEAFDGREYQKEFHLFVECSKTPI